MFKIFLFFFGSFVVTNKISQGLTRVGIYSWFGSVVYGKLADTIMADGNLVHDFHLSQPVFVVRRSWTTFCYYVKCTLINYYFYVKFWTRRRLLRRSNTFMLTSEL